MKNNEFSCVASIATCTVGYIGALLTAGLAIKNKGRVTMYTTMYAAAAAVTMLGYKWAEHLREEA